MNKPRLIQRRVLPVITLLGVLVASLVLTGSVASEGAPFALMPGYPLQGCYGVVTASTGMWNGHGTITVDVPGPVVDAWLWWAGIEDDDLIINGTPIVGTLVDTTQTLPVTHPDWFLYRFDMGGFVSQGSNTFFIEGWEPLPPPWPPDKTQRNGATLVVTYERDPACLDPSEIHVYEGLDWFWFKDASAEFASEVEAYFLEPAPFDRTVSVTFSYAGMEHNATTCRDGAVWYTSGTGSPPTQLLQHTWPASVGINGGQLVADDPWENLLCTPTFFPPATGLSGGYVGAEWAVFTLDVPVPAGAEWVAFQLESVGFWTDPNADGESGTWVGNVLEVPLATPDVTVSKDDGVTNAVPGDVLTYNIAYANIGDRFANDVVIVDTIPDRTSFVSCSTPVGTCSEAGGVVTFDLGTVAAGASGTVQVTVALDPLFPCGDTPITNAVTISTSTPGDDPSNNAAEDTDIVTAYVTVDIEKTAAPEPVEAGASLAYTLDWAVAGNCWAENTTVTDAIPALTTFVSCEPAADCSESGGVVTWNLGQVAPPANGTATFEVLVDTCLPDGTLIDNTAAITEDSGAYDEDSVTSTVHADHELAVDKVSDPSPVMKNDPLVYTILWQITGNEPANNVTICDVVPDGTTFDSATGGGVYNPATGEVCWNLGNFCPPAQGSVSFTVIVDRDLVDPAEISNTAVLCDDDPGTDCAEDQEITPVIPTSEIGDFVWLDLNGDAVQDPGEAGIPGVVLNLYAAGADGLCGTADDAWLDSRTTDANGLYLFDLLLAGSYCVDVDDTTLPADVYLSPGLADPHGPIALNPELDPAEQYLDADFGYYPGGSIGDLVWLDLDGDAVQDAGEPGIAGVTLNLLAAGADGLCGTADDVWLASDVTDANGLYLFDPLPVGVYCVDVVEATLPANVYLSPGIAEPHGPIALDPWEDYLTADFGYYLPSSIGDLVWLDADRDGVQDAGEHGIPGVKVNLLGAGADGLCGTADDMWLASDVTDANGLYLFDLLPIGTYCVDVDDTTLPEGLNLSQGSKDPYGPIVLPPDTDYLNADFGYAYPDVVIAKAVDKEYVHRYEDLTFTITVSNNGPGPAHNVVVTDRISEYLEYIRLSTTKGTVVWNSGTRTVTASIGDLYPREVVTITITGRVIGIPTADLPVTLRNVAVVDFTGETGPFGSNETTTQVVYFAPGEIPEPGTMLMLGSGLLGLAGYAQLRLRRRRREE
ncbi:MAG: SdrD B-like domain-containing protein [Anaerolineae bacterium]|nr:SdrD B-like domain-containing protein [Anaerolineae bacterium]